MVRRLLQNVVVEKLLNQVDVSEKHSTATVSLHSKLCKSLTFCLTRLEKSEVLFPFVPNDFPTGETADWDYHIDLF